MYSQAMIQVWRRCATTSCSLKFERAEGQVVHVHERAQRGDQDQGQPHQAGVLEMQLLALAAGQQTVANDDRHQQLHRADADIATGSVQT